MGAIPDETIAEIRERTDIVALVGEYVALKKRGSNHLGLCPFHSEKSPSFNVSASKQFFHCFGCKESGDALSFLMRMEGVSFPEAARSLAERAGIEIPELTRQEDSRQRQERERRERLHAIMEAATVFYERCRAAGGGEPAQRELQQRAIEPEEAERFRLGYAPNGWDHLVKHLATNDWSMQDAEDLGLVARRRDGSGHYDRFRHRLMFPVTDTSGRVRAFSGRALPPPQGVPPRDEPKYINSPEGPLYTKGELLFGLHQARVEIKRNGWALLCEGNFDLVALHQAGFRNAVAPLGTAFTAGQARLLYRSAPRLTLMFDGDSAGMKAVRTAYPLLTAQGLNGRVAALPPGEDPDSYLRSHGQEALHQLVDSAQGIVEFIIDVAADEAQGGAAERAAAIESLGPVIAATKNAVEIEIYIDRVSQRFGVSDLGALKQQLRRGVRGARKPRRGEEEQSNVVPAPPRVKLPQLQTRLLGVLLEKPQLFGSSAGKNVGELLTNTELQSIFHASSALLQESGKLDVSALLARVEGSPVRSWLEGRLAVEQYSDEEKAAHELRALAAELARHNYQEQVPKIEQAIRQARKQGDEEAAIKLTKQRDELMQTRHRMMQGLKG